MTNITLSIDNEIYKLMKKYSEIKWSEYVRKMIKKRVEELETINSIKNNESIITMLASEELLKKDWNNEIDDRWNNV